MKRFIIHADAEDELLAAVGYYENARSGLGGEFREEFELALQRVRENPLAYAAEDDCGTRRAPLHRFPYSIVYVDFKDHLWIAALAHHRRRPEYWKRRRPS